MIDTKNKPVNWRSQETHDRYMADIDAGELENGCRLCEKAPLHTFTYWKIVANKYPYDRIAVLHDMIVPIRQTDGSDLTDGERMELEALKKSMLNDTYHFVVEALPKVKSIPQHFHLHLMVPKQP